jgi:hypothetical protein
MLVIKMLKLLNNVALQPGMETLRGLESWIRLLY